MGGLILILVGSVLLTLVSCQLRKAIASENWPTTKGRVLSSGVSKIYADSETGGECPTFYKAKVLYEYWANNMEWSSKKVSFMDFVDCWKNISYAYSLRKGENVVVHCNADKPQDAVLEVKGKSWTAARPDVFLIVMGLAWIGAILVQIVVFYGR